MIGAIIFRLIYALALRLNMPTFMLKAVSSLIVILALSGPYLRKRGAELKRRRSAGKEAA